MSKIKEFILDLFFPCFCLGCNKEGTYLCEDCKSTLELLERRYCLCDSQATHISNKEIKGTCNKCSSKNLSGLYFALSFKERALTRKLIHFLNKEPYCLKDLSKSLALLLIDHFYLIEKDPKEILRKGILIPIPLKEKEMRRLGYSPAEEIAKELSQILHAPISLNNLTRKKQPDKGFTFKDLNRIKDKIVFLVDDIYTIKSPMEKVADSLCDVGAKEVWGLTIARD